MWWSDALKEELADMEAQRNKKVAELSAYKVRIINKVVEDLEDLTTCPKSLIKELGRSVALFKKAKGRAVILMGLSIQSQLQQARAEAGKLLAQHKARMVGRIYEEYDTAPQEFSREIDFEISGLIKTINNASTLSEAVDAYDDAMALIEQTEWSEEE